MNRIRRFKRPTAAKIKKLADDAILLATIPACAAMAVAASVPEQELLVNILFLSCIAVLASGLAVAIVASLFAD
ncbi:hypothetical protein [Ruegeria sp. HKCCD8929]|uniref:hypothetical protein n=1 Tax=Ruegeria sp. HKCCD8929 TaxID=2683006 RepID=UPI0014882460|nr:hypothetical protein [Ruegeria sp. HKCCD8929]